MAITLYPVKSDFMAEIGDVDLSLPLSDEDRAAIKAAFFKYSVLVFPGQELTSAQHIAFAEVFGPMEQNINTYADEVKKYRIDTRIADVSNLGDENEILAVNSRKRMSGLANRLWHTDSIFRHLPALTSLLYGRSIAPVGGRTEFADMRAAYDALPDATKTKLDKMIVEHSIFHSRAKLGFTDFTEKERASLPPAKQVMVRTIPETGRRNLYLASHAMRVIGMSDEDSEKLFQELTEHATQPQFVLSHRWRVNDLVMWDNRCTMHRGTDFDDWRWKRDVQRATVSDIGNTVELSA
ncbi:MAG: TauD/TfdA family dioxygenase [Burkholderiaceae bacterium]|nr:TauD/TfdA family dioxygenase [Burkholderiaceae bacterium]